MRFCTNFEKKHTDTHTSYTLFGGGKKWFWSTFPPLSPLLGGIQGVLKRFVGVPSNFPQNVLGFFFVVAISFFLVGSLLRVPSDYSQKNVGFFFVVAAFFFSGRVVCSAWSDRSDRAGVERDKERRRCILLILIVPSGGYYMKSGILYTINMFVWGTLGFLQKNYIPGT